MRRCNICGAHLTSEALTVCPICGKRDVQGSLPANSGKGKVKTLLGAYLYSLLFSLVTGLVIVAFVVGYSVYMGDENAIDDLSIDASNILTVIAYAVFMVLLLIINLARKKNTLDEIHLKQCSLSVLPIAALFGYTANYVHSLLVVLIPWPTEILEDHTQTYGNLASDEANVLILVFSTAVCTGIIEEIVFRGLVMGTLKKRFTPAASVVISAVIFGLAHPTVISFAYATVLGIFLGVLFEKNRSIIPCIMVHIFYNLAACIGYPENEEISAVIIITSFALHLATCLMLFKKSSAEAEADTF